MEKEMEMEETANADRQQVLRQQVVTFFADDKHYFRLKRVLDALIRSEPKVANEGTLMFHFLNKYNPGVVMSPVSRRLFKLPEEYKSAVGNYSKKYFDFGSRTGMGDLRWGGETNPAVLIREYAMPLPKCVAFMWLLQTELDTIFLAEFDAIFASFVQFSTENKERYLQNQRIKHQQLQQKKS